MGAQCCVVPPAPKLWFGIWFNSHCDFIRLNHCESWELPECTGNPQLMIFSAFWWCTCDTDSVETVLRILKLDLVPGWECAVSLLGHWAAPRQAAITRAGRPSWQHSAPIIVLVFTFKAICNTWHWQSTPNDQIGFIWGDLPTCRLMGGLWAHLRQARVSKLWCLVDQMQ